MTIADKYQAERERLELNRTLDWSTFDREFIAAGETLVPMTVQVWFDLLAVKSPILSAEGLTIEAVTDYIWRNCKRYTANPWLKEWRLFWIQRRVERCMNKDDEADALLSVIFEHVKETFDEFPTSLQKAGAASTNAMPGASGEAAMLDEIAHRYGISPEAVLTMPLRRVFALQRTIRMATIPEYKLLEPDSLRAIKSEYLKNLNNGSV
jgi:hypothetical protein